jgi:PPP family 3-phenylpropionic acid transporter
MRLRALRALGPGWRGALFYIVFWGASGTFNPFLNVHFARLGLSGQQIGVLSTMLPIVTLFAGPVLSALADRRACRTWILSVALAGLSITLLLLGLPRTCAGLIPLMALMAMFRSPVTPIADSLIARMSAARRLNYGSLRLWGSLSASLVAAFCGWLWQRVGFAPMFVLAAALTLPVALFGLALDEAKVCPQRERAPLRAVLGDPGLAAILGATFFVSLGMQTTFTFGGMYMDALGGSEFLVGLLFALSALCELPTMRFSSAIVDRLGGARTLLLSYGLFGVCFAIYALAWAPGALLLASLFGGSGFGLFFITTVRLINDRAPPEWSSTAQSLMSATSFGVASLLGGLLGGRIYDARGPAALFAGAVLMAALAAAVIVLANARGLFDTAVEQPHSSEPRWSPLPEEKIL